MLSIHNNNSNGHASLASNSSSSSSNSPSLSLSTSSSHSSSLNHQILSNNNSNNLHHAASSAQCAPKQQILNSSTIKLLNRLLDEASSTGDLFLSNKNLSEYPSKLAILYDLSDTLNCDLSKNNLTEVPRDLYSFESLEKLLLYSNQIRLIPEIGQIQFKCLKILDLNSNNLSYLPPCVCNLVQLQVLTVNNNKLVSLPEEIGSLKKLIQLDVSCNEITHLPVQIGDMNALRSLNIRRNFLVELPRELSKLKLVSFDCSSNRLSKLPLCFREMVTLIDLVVDHNPLELPPAHICTKGLLHIMKYLLVESIKEEKRRGILNEYEVNNSNSNFIIQPQNQQQRVSSSCNVGGGSGGANFGFMFQNSVKNLCKNITNTTNSTSSSSSKSSSSTSLSISQNNLQSKTLINQLPTDFHSIVYDSPPSGSPTSTSSSSSSTSSSSSITPPSFNHKTHKIIQESPNSKLVQIHEIVKPTLVVSRATNINNNSTNTRIRNSRPESQEITHNFTDEEKFHQNQIKLKYQQQQQSAVALINNENIKPKLAQIINTKPIQQNINTNLYKAVPHHVITSQNDHQHSSTVRPRNNQNNIIHRSNSQEYMNKQQHQQQVWVPRVSGCADDQIPSDVIDLELVDPTAFTFKRHLHQIQEEQKQIELLKRIIEQKLRVQLPHVTSVDELGVALADGVILCHLINQIFPRSVQSIHVPSMAMVS
jgi:Leucine-rich repeat (LRR) protein